MSRITVLIFLDSIWKCKRLLVAVLGWCWTSWQHFRSYQGGYWLVTVRVWVVRVAVYLLDAHLGNDTMVAPLLLTSGLLRYETALHSHGTSTVGERGTDLWKCILLVTLKRCLTGTSGHQHHVLLSHSVTLSWHWANQSLPHLSWAAECQATKWQF